jgi:DNA-binding transcriptional regulator GbsR (MarR family)
MSFLYNVIEYFYSYLKPEPDYEKEYEEFNKEEIEKDISKNKETYTKVIDELPTYKQVLMNNLLEKKKLSLKQKEQLKAYIKDEDNNNK